MIKSTCFCNKNLFCFSKQTPPYSTLRHIFETRFSVKNKKKNFFNWKKFLQLIKTIEKRNIVFTCTGVVNLILFLSPISNERKASVGVASTINFVLIKNCFSKSSEYISFTFFKIHWMAKPWQIFIMVDI